jgi:hypothetical protein
MRVAMLSPPSGPHGARPASRRTDSAQRCDVHTVVAAVRLRGSSMLLSTPAAPKGGRLLRSSLVLARWFPPPRSHLKR